MRLYLKILFYSFLLLSLIGAEIIHAIHISYGEVTLTNNSLYGKITFFKDDFFLGLKNWNKASLENLTNKQYDNLKLEYLKEHLIATANKNEKLQLEITGNNENDKSIWFEFKFVSEEKINQMSLKYTVLFNEFSDQMNLLNVSTASDDQSFIFNESSPELKIKT